MAAAFALFVALMAPQGIEVDPIQCWWRTSATAVRLGEPFTFVLTCAVVETDTAKVVPDQARLEPSVVQIPPFEVLGGTHAPDLRSGDRRFFQYEYTLRLIGDDLFGKDVKLPETKITYRVQSRVAQGASIEGRDFTYILPSESIRVLSLVPADAAAIREGAGESFRDIDARVFRANMLRLVAGILFALAALSGILALAKLAERYREKAPAGRGLIGDGAILRSVGRELSAIRRQREGSGWTEDLAGRTLAALRILAAYTLARHASQARVSGNGARHGEGSVAVPRGWIGGRRVLVSGSLTAQSVQDLRRSHGGDGVSGRPEVLDALESALGRLTAVRYGRDGALDETALDESLATGQGLHRRARLENTWPAKKLAALRRVVTSRGT